MEVTIGHNANDNKPVDKDAWPELPMPRDSQMLPLHSQQLLRAVRSGQTVKPPAPVEDDNEMKEEEEEVKEVPVGFTVKKFVKVARHLETPEPEYLAKRRKGLPSQYTNGQTAPALRETKVKKLDADGNVAIYKVLVPEGQAVEGEVQPTDDAIEVVPATAAPGTIVEGIGVVNAEGVVVASEIRHQTPPRKRAPPPKRRRGGPGRGRRRVTFAGRGEDQGIPNMGGDLLSTPGLQREDGSVAPSDGGDTPMADAGGEDDEGSGEEGSEDEDHDMERNSTPATPLRLPSAPPTSAPAVNDSAMNDSAMPDIVPAEQLPTAPSPVHTNVETSAPPPISDPSAPSEVVAEITEISAAPDLPDLSKLPLSRSRQTSPTTIPTLLPTTDAIVPEPTASETLVSTVQSESIPAPVLAPESVVLGEPVITPEVEAAGPEAVESEVAEPQPAEPEAAEPEATEPEAVEPEAVEPEAAEPQAAEPEASAPSAPPSEPDLLGSLERQLEQDSKDMAR